MDVFQKRNAYGCAEVPLAGVCDTTPTCSGFGAAGRCVEQLADLSAWGPHAGTYIFTLPPIERILCAAVRDIETGHIWAGHRHASILEQLEDSPNLVPGFLTSFGLFAGLSEAAVIAVKADQVHDREGVSKRGLHSHDLY